MRLFATGVAVLIVTTIAVLALLARNRVPQFDTSEDVPNLATVPDDRPALNVAPAPEESTSERGSSPKPAARSDLPTGFTQDPELRGRIVEFLTGSGLSEPDSERTADSALADLRDCAEEAFGAGDTLNRDAHLESCTLNVLADYGLPLDDPSAVNR